jgi:hypothetical protein
MPRVARSFRLRSLDHLGGAGEQSDMVRNANVRHDSRGRRSAAIEERQALMTDDTPLPFNLPAVARERVGATIDEIASSLYSSQ